MASRLLLTQLLTSGAEVPGAVQRIVVPLARTEDRQPRHEPGTHENVNVCAVPAWVEQSGVRGVALDPQGVRVRVTRKELNLGVCQLHACRERDLRTPDGPRSPPCVS